MKTFNILIIFYIIFNNFSVIGQLGVYTGYDFGFIKLPFVNTETFIEEHSYNNIHRFTIIADYKFKNNILLAFGLGLDQYIRNKESSQRSLNEITNTCTVKNTKFNARFNTFRFELGVGYKFKLNDNFSLIPSLALESLTLNRIVFTESSRIVTSYSETCNNNSEPVNQKESFIDLADYGSLYGYPNKKIITPIFNASLELRQKINQFNLSYYVTYSNNSNNNRVIRGKYFLFGLRVGYTFPVSEQKSKNNEK